MTHYDLFGKYEIVKYGRCQDWACWINRYVRKRTLFEESYLQDMPERCYSKYEGTTLIGFLFRISVII